MRQILEACVKIEETAEAAYRDMQSRCSDSTTAALLGHLAAGKRLHAEWWRELIEEWDAGRLADAWPSTRDVRQNLEATALELSLVAKTTVAALDAREALQAAARIEFLTLDPAFAELIELSEPGLAHQRHESFDSHIDALAGAIVDKFGSGSADSFMATVLRHTRHNNRAATRYATRDPLTGLGNRRALAAQAGQWAAWSARYGGAMSFVVVDVDKFRMVNDVWGHGIGDRALVALGAAIGSTVRSADLVTRLGDDEFIVLAPELEPDGAKVLAARLVAAVGALHVPAEGDGYLSMTASAGIVTVFDPPDSHPRSLDDILAAADQALTAAKAAGPGSIAEPIVLVSPPDGV